jgi:hypothetical protein
MAPVFTEHYQLGHGGSLVFEHDLTTLTLFLDRLYPEFKEPCSMSTRMENFGGLSGQVAVARREI